MWKIMLGLILLLSVLPAIAQEPVTDPVNENWCYNPARWQGDCGDASTFESEWHWTCGWYMAGFERGEITRAFIETTYCKELLPPLPPPSTSTVIPDSSGIFTGGSVCYDSSTTYEDVRFLGLNVFSPYFTSEDGTCSGAPAGDVVLVEATDYKSAVAACLPFPGYNASIVDASQMGFSFPPTYWFCIKGSSVPLP